LSKRRTKVRYDRITILLVGIVAIAGILSGIFNNTSVQDYLLSKKTGYSTEVIKVFREKNILKDISSNKYSNTLVSAINSDNYIDKYLTDYLHINYKNDKDFISNINSLLEIGYNYNEINKIEDTLKSDSINIVISNEYNEQLLDYIGLSYFKEENLERYLNYYQDNSDMDYTDIITYVNIGLDNDYYTNVINIDNQDDLQVLVNKYHKLDNDYIPSDLETISSKYQWIGRSNQLRHDARVAFEEMCAAAADDGIYIYAGSGYRSYATQKYLYDTYVKRDGFDEAETYSARAGYSEHQTGLAMDIANKNGFISLGDKEYDWLVNNSYKYGFILRYPKGSETLTGYMYEEWHYRYLGKEVAKEVYESNLTYEEYLAKK
jgi:LAS superfamily LD-carboxypeptidase LdcB